MELVYKKDKTGKDILCDKEENHQVMMEWEKPYMEESIKQLNPFGKVLEIGFGLGYTATKICSFEAVKEYNVIECTPIVWDKFEEFKNEQEFLRPELKVNLIKGRWEDVLQTTGIYDCIYFDDYILSSNQPINDRFDNFLYNVLLKHTIIGSRISVFSNNNVKEKYNTINCIKVECIEYKIDIPDYCKYAKEIIKPSKIIENNIPNNLNNSYGIHLRKTDKVNNKNHDMRHLSTIEEFTIMSNALFNDICKIILNESNPSFLITSDENSWKEYFKNELLIFAKNNNKTINFINVNYDNSNTYDNYNAILDLFCLSKCKKIFQDVKYSTFSIVASIIGNNEIINYSHLLEVHKYCLINLYHPVININNNKNYNIDYINEILTACEPIYSNFDIKSL